MYPLNRLCTPQMAQKLTKRQAGVADLHSPRQGSPIPPIRVYLPPVNDHVVADARRSRPAYRVCVWLYRLAFVLAAAYVIAMATRALPVLRGPSLLLFLLVYVACLAAAEVLFVRMGIRIFALALVPTDGPLGNSDAVKANRKTFYRDVFGRAH